MVYRSDYLISEETYYGFLSFLEVFITNVCSDSESWRYWYADKVHFRQVGTLTSEQVSHVCLTFSLTIAEGINSFFAHSLIKITCI